MLNPCVRTFLQSRNWDGGYQELSTATQCVRDVFPDSKITPNVVDNYPIRVIVTATNGGGKEIEIWSGRQQDLFRKNASRRLQAIETIKTQLKEYQSKL